MRLWNLANVRVIDFADCHEMVTAAAFSPDGEQVSGRRAVPVARLHLTRARPGLPQVAVGTKAGKCRFYACENSKMSYSAQLDVCTNKSHNRKITGVQFLPGQPDKVDAPFAKLLCHRLVVGQQPVWLPVDAPLGGAAGRSEGQHEGRRSARMP